MFGTHRRSPLRGLALIALGFVLASVFIGGGSAAAAGVGLGLLVLPFLVLKLLFMFMVFGALFRFVGAGGPWRGGSGWRGGPWQGPGNGRHKSDDFYPWERTEQQRQADTDRREWEESLRQARAEVDDIDRPSTRPPGDFEPPAPSGESD